MSEREVTPEDRHEMGRMVREILGDKADKWWMTPNPMFGGIPPMWLATANGSAERRVRNFIFDAYENNRASLQVGW